MITSYSDHAANQDLYQGRAQHIFDSFDNNGLIDAPFRASGWMPDGIGYLVEKIEYNKMLKSVTIYAAELRSNDRDTYSIEVPAILMDQGSDDTMLNVYVTEELENKVGILSGAAAIQAAQDREKDLQELARLQKKLGLATDANLEAAS
jgi:hypothetical protein